MPRTGEFGEFRMEVQALLDQGIADPVTIAEKTGASQAKTLSCLQRIGAKKGQMTPKAQTEGTEPEVTELEIKTGAVGEVCDREAKQPASASAHASRPKERQKGPGLAAAVACEKCPHQVVCRLCEDRRRAYEALSRAAGQLPTGLLAEFKVRCRYGEEAAALATSSGGGYGT